METHNMKSGDRKHTKKFVTGLIVILAGLLLLAFNFDFLSGDWRHIIFSWQTLLIAIGAVSIASSENRTPGFILITIGVFFLIPELFDFHISFVKLFWPVLLIVIGVLILVKRSNIRHTPRLQNNQTQLDEGYLNETNIFGGSKKKIIYQEIKGGKISNIFGGSEIDLTQATLADGRNELVIECMFGGVTLIVPSDWKVVLNVSSILGGFSDKRTIIKEPFDSNKLLVIRGSAIFGGGEIKSY
jgi:predicted membrane protein